MNDALKNVALLVVSLLLALLAVEAVLGVLQSRSDVREDPAPFYLWSFNTVFGERIGRDGPLGLSMHPHAVFFNTPDQQGPYWSTDRRGFRGPRSGAGPDAEVSIAVVGGSTAFGTGLTRDADTFPARLEARTGLPTLNAAVIGHLSGQELAFVVSDVLELEPGLVIALDGWNDLVDQLEGWPRREYTAGVSHAFFLMGARLRRLHLLEQGGPVDRVGTALAILFPNVTALVSRRQSGFAIPPPQELENTGTIRRDPEALAEIYADNMRKLDVIARAFGARFLCVIQPDGRLLAKQWDGLARQYDRFRRAASSRLAEHGVEFLDLNRFAGVLQPAMFMDRIHLDAKGNRAMAAIVTDTLEERNLLPAKDGP